MIDALRKGILVHLANFLHPLGYRKSGKVFLREIETIFLHECLRQICSINRALRLQGRGGLKVLSSGFDIARFDLQQAAPKPRAAQASVQLNRFVEGGQSVLFFVLSAVDKAF